MPCVRAVFAVAVLSVCSIGAPHSHGLSIAKLFRPSGSPAPITVDFSDLNFLRNPLGITPIGALNTPGVWTFLEFQPAYAISRTQCEIAAYIQRGEVNRMSYGI